ncbi:hypothetical protein BCR39DRAFT_499090 [Naematelia encephala]|uniref:Peptide hydrolase n=1 Tax=Naematelia encephala TaxID=71784 RepID=A0A1Y2ASL1_9TREE|nr:hypothetical protein BCR39DRAFT_499090 [Naematelia encephala]
MVALSRTILASLLATLALASPLYDAPSQLTLSTSSPSPRIHAVPPSILAALEAYPDDPVEALLSLRPEMAQHLAEQRLLHVFEHGEPTWMTEGDKMRLRRLGLKFMDLTERRDLADGANQLMAGKAHMPNLTQQKFVKPCFADISTKKMHDVLHHMTSYYSRYYHSTTGAQSATWLHDHIAEIIAASPFQTYISLEYHTHHFLQSSIVARFEPPVRNASLPLTIIGAHQDSANYLFPLLPAPGADDDCSGSVSILEAFRVLATRGFIPTNGPVEFHWYAAEEAGLLGSLDLAGYKKDLGMKVGAMLEFDMTAFIHANSTEAISFIKDEADPDLTEWCASLAREYSDLPVTVTVLNAPAGSDYMSWTRAGYPSAFATEGDPVARGSFPGDFDPYVHTVKDRMDVDDESGVFSLDHMARFSELAIAFVVEQAGWSLKHTRADDNKQWDI